MTRRLEYDSSDRMFITGMTKSGKTYFARRLIRQQPRVVALDPKGDDTDGVGLWGLAPWDRETRRMLAEGEPVRARVVYERGDPGDFWEEVMAEVYEAGDAVLYIDEVGALSPQSVYAPDVMYAVWTRGRSAGVGAIAASQRPRMIPKMLITESEHKVVFRLQSESDRKYMVDEGGMGEPVAEEIPRDHPHGFWYQYISWYEPIYVPQLPDVGGGEGWGEFQEEVQREAA